MNVLLISTDESVGFELDITSEMRILPYGAV